MNRYASCQDELLMFSYLCGTVYVSSFCLFTGDLVKGAAFLRHEVRLRGAVAQNGWMDGCLTVLCRKDVYCRRDVRCRVCVCCVFFTFSTRCQVCVVCFSFSRKCLACVLSFSFLF